MMNVTNLMNTTNDIRLGLNSICDLCNKLDNPQDKLRFIHITGTNGKGSTGAFIATILKEAGYKTGHYSSPAVFSREEIIKVNGRSISKKNYDELMSIIDAKCQELVNEGKAWPTPFERQTALAFLHFFNEGCDIVVLEVGMGGATDATNIVRNTLVSVFTPISVDHTDYLGKTIEEIARVKAGIIKPGSRVVTAPQNEKVYDILNGASEDIIIAKPMKFKRGQLGLEGVSQEINAQVAVQTIQILREAGFNIVDKAIDRGLKNTKLCGRFEKIYSSPTIIIDGGHNVAAARSIRENLLKLYGGRRVIMICGMLVNKEHAAYFNEIADVIETVLTVSTSENRAYSAEELAKDAIKYLPNVSAIGGVEEAIDIARMMANPKDVILICGSFTILDAAVKHIKKLSR